MSKFGYDLPPGVTSSMLPGNSKEDADREELYEVVSQFWESEEGEPLDNMVDMIETRIAAAYRAGHIDGGREAEGERQQRECELMAEGRFCYLRLRDGSWHPCAQGDPGATLFLASGE